MKNLLITICTAVTSFVITWYILINLSSKPDQVIEPANNTNEIAVIEETEEPVPTESEDLTENDVTESKSISTEGLPDIESITSSKKNWDTYFKDNINLSSDFLPVNAQGEDIEKGNFLKQLVSGNYIPVMLLSGNEAYQLYPIEEGKEKIGKAVKSVAKVAYAYYNKEGTKYPDFNVVDLNGNRFSSENTKGKILIVKCWFITCKVCVEEFPQLNQLYDKYEAYEDVVFLSLAFDEADKLRKFLTKKQFRYPVVANQKGFMKDKIQVKQYPTHLIIDEDGNIEKMVSSVAELTTALEKIAAPDLTDLDGNAGF